MGRGRGPPKLTSQASFFNDDGKPVTSGSDHCPQLLLAIGMLLIYTVTTITTALIVKEYYDDERYAAAFTLIAFYILKSVTQIVLDYVSFGRLCFLWADLLQLREFVDFAYYIRDWRAMRGQHWPHPFYRAHAAYSTFMPDVPSLLIQVYVYLRENSMTDMQVVCMVLTAVTGVWNYLQYFQYVRVSKSTYVYMIIKGALTTAMRVTLAAFLMINLQAYIYIWLGLTYLAGVIIVVSKIKRSRAAHRDTPLQFTACEAVYTHVVAIHAIFFSFPWAPSHSVLDWWKGYVAIEVKLAIEHGLGIALMFIVYSKERNVTFYAVTFFGGCALIAHYILLFFINMSVSRYLRRRSMYTTTKIVGMFTYFCTYIQERISGEAQPDGGILLEREMTEKQLSQSRKQKRDTMMSQASELGVGRASGAFGRSSMASIAIVEEMADQDEHPGDDGVPDSYGDGSQLHPQAGAYGGHPYADDAERARNEEELRRRQEEAQDEADDVFDGGAAYGPDDAAATYDDAVSADDDAAATAVATYDDTYVTANDGGEARRIPRSDAAYAAAAPAHDDSDPYASHTVRGTSPFAVAGPAALAASSSGYAGSAGYYDGGEAHVGAHADVYHDDDKDVVLPAAPPLHADADADADAAL